MTSQDHYFSIKMGCGQSTNTRFELLALWALLVISKDFGLPSLHVCGDSTTIINWVNGRATLTTLNLDGWCQNIRIWNHPFSFLTSIMYIENTMWMWMAYQRRHFQWPLASYITLNSLKVNVLGMEQFSFMAYSSCYIFDVFIFMSMAGLSITSFGWLR